MMNRTKSAYGGFLPLELNEGQEYFTDYACHLRRYNSVKAALYYLLKKTDIKSIYVPYYYCPTTIHAIKSTGIAVSFYHINQELLPENLPDKEDTAVLLVNYFGVRTEEIKSCASGFTNAVVIIDNAHAFFSEPVMAQRVYQLYSAKKFFGVPDGAYLIGKDVSFENADPGCSYEYADYLLLTYEAGTNASYQKKKDADTFLRDHPGPMSALALGLLGNVDYFSVENRRKHNFMTLHAQLGSVNELSLTDSCAAYHYPLLLSGRGRGVKRALVENKIYVPTLWKGEDLLQNGNAFELSMSDDAVFLPVDQRYNEGDIMYIAEFLMSLTHRMS